MEETVPKKFANRAHVKKHVEYPNKDESKVLYLRKNSSLERFATQRFLFSLMLLNREWQVIYIKQSQ